MRLAHMLRGLPVLSFALTHALRAPTVERVDSFTPAQLASQPARPSRSFQVRSTLVSLAPNHGEILEPRGFEPLTSSMPLRRSTN
jgi:hypothetical protein